MSLAMKNQWNTMETATSSMPRKSRSGSASDPAAPAGRTKCAFGGKNRKVCPGANELVRQKPGQVSTFRAAAKGGKGCLPVTSVSGSYTVEAALVLPLFLFAAVTVLSFCRILQVEWGIQTAMHEAVRGAAFTVGAQDSDLADLATKGGVAAAVRGKIAAEDVPLGFIKSNQLGITFLRSNVTDDEITLVADYAVKPLVPLPGYHGMLLQNRAYARRFTGFVPGSAGEEETYVYVTPSGEAYHRDLNCAYLNPSIRCIGQADLSGERNADGGKYHACPLCKGKGFGGALYVTNYGTVYHTRVSCPALKRTIKREKLSDVEGRYHACPKCGGGAPAAENPVSQGE